MKNRVVGTLCIGVAVSLLVGFLLVGSKDPRVVPIAVIIGLVGALLS